MKILITESQYNLLKEATLPYKLFKNDDHNTFLSILKGIGAPITPENIAFMYAWRECETSLGASASLFCNNPFNTTWDMDKKGIKFCSKESNMYCKTNSHGVKSYKNMNIGINATIKTILSGNYPNLLNSLKDSQKNNWNCLQIAKNLNGDLNKWGTQDKHVISKCNSYLKGATPAPANIIQVTGCK